MEDRKKITILIVLAILAVTGLLAWQIYLSLTFRLTNSIPKPKGTVSTALKTFVLEFNKELDSSVDYLKNVSDEVKHVTKIKAEGKTLEIRTKDLTDGKRYNFTIKNIKSKSGSVIPQINFDYTARYIAFDRLPKDQQRLVERQEDQLAEDNPILSRLPYGDVHFRLSAEFEEEEESTEVGELYLKAEILLSASDVRSDPDAAVAIYKQEVLDYIKSLGFDPASYKIDYEIIEPSLY